MTAKSYTTLASDLATNLSDNTAGNISASDVRTMFTDTTDSILGCFGGLLVASGASAQSLTTSEAKITQFAATTATTDNITASHANDNLTVLVAGTYLITFTGQFKGTSTDTYTFYIAVDDVAVSNVQGQFSNSGTLFFSVDISTITALTANQVVTLRGKSDVGGGSNCTLVNGQLLVTRLR